MAYSDNVLSAGHPKWPFLCQTYDGVRGDLEIFVLSAAVIPDQLYSSVRPSRACPKDL